ncbi:MAG: UrcA family protein [Gammaproteobacteria bacterium]|nr:UrcA family protein [Gammaproteobacteria bacterium]MBV8306837.1 UrcA family protein [Gammaproteobacteria bacterium]MBV8404559.1 UrcA family protein [Gammaproteobacteria bacterium]
MKVRTPHIAIAIGCVAVTGIALAQVPEIVVEAPYHRPASAAKAAPGAKELLPEVSVDYRVRYADLDLSTHSGAVELQKRIKDSAAEACKQLATLYPNSTEGVGKDSCVDGAVNKAMVDANKAIASAEKAKK